MTFEVCWEENQQQVMVKTSGSNSRVAPTGGFNARVLGSSHDVSALAAKDGCEDSYVNNHKRLHRFRVNSGINCR